jgi:putative membrane protein
MTMWLDAILAYLHYIAIFTLVAFLVVQLVLVKRPLDAATVRLLGRLDIGYFVGAMAVLVTGFLRAIYGAKGPDFYFDAWPVYVKIGLFLAIGIISIKPTLTFIQWRRELDHDPAWRVPADQQGKIRRLVLIEIHLAALIPVFAVIMSRGLGR